MASLLGYDTLPNGCPHDWTITFKYIFAIKFLLYLKAQGRHRWFCIAGYRLFCVIAKV